MLVTLRLLVSFHDLNNNHIILNPGTCVFLDQDTHVAIHNGTCFDLERHEYILPS